MTKTSWAALARKLKISPGRALEAMMKAQLISAIIDAAEETGITHAEIARGSGVPRPAVTGILSGSLQKVSLERILRLLEAVNLTVQVKVKKAA